MSASADFNRWLRAIFRSARTRQEAQALDGRLDAMREEWDQSQRNVDTQLAAMHRESIANLNAISERMDAAQREAREALRALSDADESARRELRESMQAALRASTEVLEARFAELDGHHRTLRMRLDRAAPEMPEAPAMSGEWTAMAFAEKFRGPVADIRSRLSVYVADVAQASVQALSPGLRNLFAGPQDSGIVAMRKEH